jgi:MCRA family
MMPYITAFFLPRRDGDRPKVVPEGAVNFGFLGQLAESHPRDVIFTVEYSVRTAMEAVYTLLDIERGVPEPWGSQYDIRALLNSAIVMRDGEKLKLPHARGRWNEFRDVWVSESRSDPVEDRNQRAVAGLRVLRRTRRQRADGRDTQEPSAGDSHGPLEPSGETESTGYF